MRYQYTSSGYNERFTTSSFIMPGGVKFLLVLNILIFILTELSGYKSFLFSQFGLVPSAVLQQFKLWQLFTYLFLHGGFFHIVFNMLFLWILGKDLERDWGKSEFLFFYFFCGIGAGLMTIIINFNSLMPTVGASGAIYGVLVAYGFAYPNRIVYLYGIVPLKVKYMVFGLGIIAFFASLSGSQSNISHIAHLSGMIIGLIVIFFNLKWGNFKMWYFQFRLKNISQQSAGNNEEENQIKRSVDEILDKLNDSGWDSLTDKEEKYLTRASKRLFGDRPPN